MEFRCRLGTDDGEVLDGIYTAENEAKLRRDLESRGLCILSIRRRGWSGLPALDLPRRRRVAPREFIVFNQELAALLGAGIPLVESLDIVRRRADNALFQAVLDDVYERVRSGAALSAAFEAQGDLFPGVYTASVLAGEKSGGLEEVLRRYIAYARVIGSVRRRTLSALAYPGILLLLSVLVVAIIVLEVVPQFADFYAGMNAELPLATQVLMGVSVALREFWVLVAAAAGGVAVAVWRLLASPGRRPLLDRTLLRTPLVGALASKFAASQLARTLATLLGGGIPLVSALDIAARSIGNRHVAAQLASVSREVREGRALAASMAARGVFPAVAVRMVEVGESSGALQDMLNSVADFFDEEIETTLSRFMTLIEPVLLVVMGVVIAALLLALYWPLLQLGSVVQ